MTQEYKIQQQLKQNYYFLQERLNKLEQLSQDYVNNGPPKKLRAKIDNCDYIFAHVLGSLEGMTKEEKVRFANKVKRFQDQISHLQEYCERQISKFERKKSLKLNDIPSDIVSSKPETVPSLRSCKVSEISINKSQDEPSLQFKTSTPIQRSRSPLLALNDRPGQDLTGPIKENNNELVHSPANLKPTVNEIYESPPKLKISSSNYLSSKSLKQRQQELNRDLQIKEANLPRGVVEFTKTEAEVFQRYMSSINLTHFLKKTQRGTFIRFKLKQTFELELNDQVLKFMESFQSFKEEVKFKDFKECA